MHKHRLVANLKLETRLVHTAHVAAKFHSRGSLVVVVEDLCQFFMVSLSPRFGYTSDIECPKLNTSYSPVALRSRSSCER